MYPTAALVEKSGVNQIADYLHSLGQGELPGKHLGMGERLVDTSREIRHLQWITNPADLETLTYSLHSLTRALGTGGYEDTCCAIRCFGETILPHLPRQDPRVAPACESLQVALNGAPRLKNAAPLV